ncbi:MAG TPA: tRNA pseudouridine(13) synthase TruD [Haliangiales bacterium]|nr:tRNA pseudouridine(13) synthase TruD [Haliangiales bacterium]
MRGVGGRLRVAPEDFVVEEIPAYEPAGVGAHVLATLEKRGLTTAEAVRRLASALGVRADDIGVAGQKDKRAVARQRVSLPPPVTPEAALALGWDDLRILAAARHPHKLRTGHLRGNRFVVAIRDLAAPPAEALARAGAILARLAAPPGAPNFYGEQRFAPGNVEAGRALVRGERLRLPPRERRFAVSALQADLFNRLLEQRLQDGLYRAVITGDILERVETGGQFETSDPAVDAPRVAAGEIVPTGAMFGHDARMPSPGTEAAAREAAVLSAAGLALDDFRRAGGLARGTRRAFAVRVSGAQATLDGDALVLTFALPAGAYATVVAAEVMKDATLDDR